MTSPRIRPPGQSDERTQLLGWLDLQRALVHYKCEGLSEQDAHRALLPTSPAMTIAGLVSHLRWVEHCWFEVLFLDRPADGNPQFGEVEDADFHVGDTSLRELLEEYARQCAVSDEITAAASLDDLGQNAEYGATGLTLRWMLLHMLEETDAAEPVDTTAEAEGFARWVKDASGTDVDPVDVQQLMAPTGAAPARDDDVVVEDTVGRLLTLAGLPQVDWPTDDDAPPG